MEEPQGLPALQWRTSRHHSLTLMAFKSESSLSCAEVDMLGSRSAETVGALGGPHKLCRVANVVLGKQT